LRRTQEKATAEEKAALLRERLKEAEMKKLLERKREYAKVVAVRTYQCTSFEFVRLLPLRHIVG